MARRLVHGVFGRYEGKQGWLAFRVECARAASPPADSAFGLHRTCTDRDIAPVHGHNLPTREEADRVDATLSGGAQLREHIPNRPNIAVTGRLQHDSLR